MNNQNKLGLVVLLAGVAGNLLAGTLTNYTSGDVLICFRNPSGYDLVVDAGPLSNLTSLSPNTAYAISDYTATQLGDIGGVNGPSWSAFTWQDSTLYMSRARATNALEVQTSPWVGKSALNQQATGSRISTIPPGAAVNFGAGFNDGNSSATAVVEEDITIDPLSGSYNPNYPSGNSYHEAIGSGLNFKNTFQGNPENTVPAGFSTSGKVQRSDFYQIDPGNPYGYAPGTLLGYFQLSASGTMTYVAYPSAVPTLSVSRSGNQTTITYTTGQYGTYTLRSHGTLGDGVPPTSWSAVTTLGNDDPSNPYTIQFTDNAANQYYTITAQ